MDNFDDQVGGSSKSFGKFFKNVMLYQMYNL